MIVTVTMNPALDKTAEITQLVPGELNRLQNVRIDAGGKGINVSKMIAVLGGQSVCTGFVGGASGRELCRRIDALQIANEFLTVENTTRTNLKVVDTDGRLTELNEPGIQVTEPEISALLCKVQLLAGKGDIVVLSGSLPYGADADIYRLFVQSLRENGCKVILDADSEAFRKALAVPPHMIKPNRFELLQYYGLPGDTPDERLPELCRPLLQKGMEWVVLSMGSEGAMFFTPQISVKARALPVKIQSTVGAGDSMVGAMAYALEMGLPFEETVRLAMAASIGAVTTLGTNPPSLEIVQELKEQIITQII